MDSISWFLEEFAGSVWSMLVDSAFLLLVGFVLAGVVRLLLNEKTIPRLFYGSRKILVAKAALVGVPLPLCSCSVLPVADQLRRSGLNRGATTAFLVSTPETGVDSIALTYSLTDPVMTIARPVTAFVSAMAAGLFVSATETPQAATVTDAATGEPSCACSPHADAGNSPASLWVRMAAGLRYAFVDLLGDLAPYLFFGYLLAGLVAVFLGGDITSVPDTLRVGWGGYLGAIVVGLPLYVCATSSTPLAAVLLSAGFSPGAVLVFLLVGPATNLASLTVVRKILSGWATVKYLAAIIVVSVIFGVALDRVYVALDFTPAYLSRTSGGEAGFVNIASAALLAIYITYWTVRKAVRRWR
ncbi:MAG: SO_0444 family Cu/Zn efflux transporter [Candidatus Zixiibacteriota bacterium]|nr:MAG: SO_0444 family Cu/Zn efflux transporter [candidate division Zixibacteria bacterium]